MWSAVHSALSCGDTDISQLGLTLVSHVSAAEIKVRNPQVKLKTRKNKPVQHKDALTLNLPAPSL